MSDDGEPRTPMEIAHARAGHLAWDMQETIKDLCALRLDPIGAPYVAAELSVLLECKTALDVLASNILEGADRKLRIVKNG